MLSEPDPVECCSDRRPSATLAVHGRQDGTVERSHRRAARSAPTASSTGCTSAGELSDDGQYLSGHRRLLLQRLAQRGVALLHASFNRRVFSMAITACSMQTSPTAQSASRKTAALRGAVTTLYCRWPSPLAQNGRGEQRVEAELLLKQPWRWGNSVSSSARHFRQCGLCARSTTARATTDRRR